MPLGDHLGSYEHVNFPLLDGFEYLAPGALFCRNIRVEPRRPYARKNPPYLLLDLLRADTRVFKIMAAALRANVRYGNAVAAVMALQKVLPFVKREAYRAIKARYRVAAVPAGKKPRKTAPVQKKKRLLALTDGFPDCRDKPFRYNLSLIFLHVENFNVRHGYPADPFLEIHGGNLSCSRVMKRLD